MRLYSYVVRRDTGFAPNPSGGYCTLVKCKFQKKKPNIVELAKVGDWIAGTGGADLRISAGHGKLIYAMRVDEKIPFTDYSLDPRFAGREDAFFENCQLFTWALVSQHYYYFGRDAIEIPEPFLSYPLEKRGPGYRNRFSQEFIDEFVCWLESSCATGKHGESYAVYPK